MKGGFCQITCGRCPNVRCNSALILGLGRARPACAPRHGYCRVPWSHLQGSLSSECPVRAEFAIVLEHAVPDLMSRNVNSCAVCGPGDVRGQAASHLHVR